MEEYSQEEIMISVAFVGIMLLTLILLIISMIVNARNHKKVDNWIAKIQTLCKEIKTDNNAKHNEIKAILFSSFDDVKSRQTTIINSLSNLANDIQILKRNISTIDTNVCSIIDIQRDSYSKLNSVSNDLKQSITSSLEKVYHSNNDWLNKNIKELLNNNVSLKQKADTLENYFAKYNSEFSQKLDFIKKEQVNNWNQHLEYLESFKEQILENEIINEQIQKTVSDIAKQEQILNDMVQKHIAIADYSKEIFENSEGILELMKAMLLDSLIKEVDNIKK